MSGFFDLSRMGYGVPLLWIFGGGALIGLMPREPVTAEGQTHLRWSRAGAFALAAPLILWAGFRSGGEDTTAYIIAFDRMPASVGAIPAVLRAGEKDPGYAVLVILVKALGILRHREFFLLVAAVQVLCMIPVMRRYSVSYWTSIFLFVASTDYLSWMENGMRQFLAVCITFAAFPMLVERKYGRYCLMVLAASTIHRSALLMLPLGWCMDEVPLGPRTMAALTAAVVSAVMIDRVLPLLEALLELTPYAGVTRSRIWAADDGTHLLRVAVYSVPAVLALAGKRFLSGADRAAALCVNSAVLTMALYLLSAVTSGIYVGRLPIYTTLPGYIALPWLLERMFTPRSEGLVKGIMICCYLMFYDYQIRVAWGW